MTIVPSSSVVRHADVVDLETDGEIVAMNMDAGTCFGLNKVGSRIWKLIESPARVADVCAVLVQEYDVDAATCEQQVVEMLEGLKAERLVDECESIAPA